jgi:hypothetical protein
MARRRQILVTAAVVVAAGAVSAYVWRSWPRNVADDLQQAYVTELTVTTDGKPLPETIRTGESHVILVRFRLPAERRDESHVALFMVVGPEGYGGNPDVIEAFVQSGARNAPRTRLTIVRDGREVDVTPKPPADGDPVQQYCALLNPAFFTRNNAASGQRELHLWLYPRNTAPDSPTSIGGEGRLIFMHRFNFERVDGGESVPAPK